MFTLASLGIGQLILVSTAVFLFVILLLVMLLLFAMKKLTPQGEVTININGKKDFEVHPGTSLLSTLSANEIYLPSACGGGGTCGMCKCQILEGACDVLPTEKTHLTRKEIANKWRVACQVKI